MMNFDAILNKRCLKVKCNHSSNYISRLWGQLGILINVDLATHLPQNVSK